jgi:hypothetical protein
MLLSKRTYKRTHSHPKILEPPHPSLSTVLRKKEKVLAIRKAVGVETGKGFANFFTESAALFFSVFYSVLYPSPPEVLGFLSDRHPKSNSN